VDLFELTKALVNIPSVTGEEGALVDFLVPYLRNLAFTVREQKVERKRRNVFAAPRPKPKVILCTHLDTVPGWFGASEDRAYIYGRGACDAKGIMAAMIEAVRILDREGTKDVGLLFVVGEETDSSGALKANALDLGSKFIVVGEPTGNKLGRGHKGILTFRLSAKGRRAHSASPQRGRSAIEKLLDALGALRALDFGEDPLLGRCLVNIGRIEGGIAANVVSDSAGAVVSVRTPFPTERILHEILRTVGRRVSVEVVTKSEPQVLNTVPGFRTTVLPYGTDIPYLTSFGKPLLLGPGSIADAHTKKEKIEKKQLRESVFVYIKLAGRLMMEK